MSNASEKVRARLFNLLSKIGIMVTDGNLDAEYYADVLQAVMGKDPIHIGKIVQIGAVSPLLCPQEQVERWWDANSKGELAEKIPAKAFDTISSFPILFKQDISDGFVGAGLFHGFGDDGNGNADPLLSGELSWARAKEIHKKNWTSDYVKFKEGWMRLRPEAWLRPKGFFWKKVHLGQNYQGKSVSDDRKMFPVGDTGASFEALQLAGILIPEYIKQMNGKGKPFWDMPDYDVAPDGASNFCSSACLFVGDHELRLDCGLVDCGGSGFGALGLR